MPNPLQHATLRDIGAPTLARSSVISLIASTPDTRTLAEEREADEYAGKFNYYRERGMTPKQIRLLLGNPRR